MASGQGCWTRLSLEDIDRLESESQKKGGVTAEHFENGISSIDLIKAKKLKHNELGRTGSEAILKRVNQTLASLTVDPLFYVEQVLLSSWRYKILKSNFCIDADENLGYLVTQSFYEAIQSIRSPEVPVPELEERDPAPSIETNQPLGWKAALKFVVPYATLSYLACLHTPEKLNYICLCLKCQNLLNTAVTHIVNYPSSVPLTELALRTWHGNTVTRHSNTQRFFTSKNLINICFI